MFHICRDVVIDKNQFRIVENTGIQVDASTAMAMMQRIEEVVRNKLPYVKESRDKYSLLPQREIYLILKNDAKKIQEKFRKNTKSIFFRIPDLWAGATALTQVNNACYRIEMLVSPPQVLKLPDVLVQEVNGFLGVHEMALMAQVNKHGYAQANKSMVTRARELGYQGRDVVGAKQHLKSFLSGMKTICEREDIPKKYIIFTSLDEIDDEINIIDDEIDAEATLKHIKANPIVGPGWDPSCSLAHYCDKGLLDAVKVLLHLEADPNTLYMDGSRPLDHAALSGSLELVSLLLAHKADARQSCGLHSTLMPYVYAVPDHNYIPEITCQTKKIIKLLLEAGADPNGGTPHHDTMTALHMAMNNHPEALEIITLLLDYGADVNALDNGLSPLYWLVVWGDAQHIKQNVMKPLAELLLRAGADPNIGYGTGDRLSKLAESYGYDEVAALLRSYEQE